MAIELGERTTQMQLETTTSTSFSKALWKYNEIFMAILWHKSLQPAWKKQEELHYSLKKEKIIIKRCIWQDKLSLPSYLLLYSCLSLLENIRKY